MRTSVVAIATAAFFTTAQAHFQLQYPAPRGKFVEDDEPNFCDGYKSVGSRTSFPLTGGVIALNSEHEDWAIGALLSTSSDPQSFADFNISGQQVLAVPFSKQRGEGVYCLPVDIQALGLSNVKDGANVTLQLVFNGGDGNLYQCADLTLSSNAETPSASSLNCKNATQVPSASQTITGANSATSSGASASSTAPSGSKSATPSPSATGSGGNGAASMNFSHVGGLLALFIAGIVTLV